MNSGLYALAGASATATAAAWANRLDEPMTNVSKVYFGFSRAGSALGRGTRPCSTADVPVGQVRPDGGAVGPRRSRPRRGARVLVGRPAARTVTATRISRPSWPDSASAITGRQPACSSTSLVNSFGTASSAVSSTSPSGRVSAPGPVLRRDGAVGQRRRRRAAHTAARGPTGRLTQARRSLRSPRGHAGSATAHRPRCPHGSPQAVYMSPTDRCGTDPRVGPRPARPQTRVSTCARSPVGGKPADGAR